MRPRTLSPRAQILLRSRAEAARHDEEALRALEESLATRRAQAEAAEQELNDREVRQIEAQAALETQAETVVNLRDRLAAERTQIEAERTRLRAMWNMVEDHRKQAATFLSSIDSTSEGSNLIDLTEELDDSSL